jgi:hypothetical protein
MRKGVSLFRKTKQPFREISLFAKRLVLHISLFFIRNETAVSHVSQFVREIFVFIVNVLVANISIVQLFIYLKGHYNEKSGYS